MSLEPNHESHTSQHGREQTDIATTGNTLCDASDKTLNITQAKIETLPSKRMYGVRCITDEHRSTARALAEISLCMVVPQGEACNGS